MRSSADSKPPSRGGAPSSSPSPLRGGARRPSSADILPGIPLRPDAPATEETRTRTALDLARVLGAGSSSLKRALAALGENHVDFVALQSAFDAAQAELYAHEVALETGGTGEVAAEREGGDGISAAELTALLTGIDAEGMDDDWGLLEARYEEAGITVQLIVQGSDDEAIERAGERLRVLRRREIDEAAASKETPLPSCVAAVLTEAVVDLAESLPIRAFDEVYALLAPTFRRVVSPLLDHLPRIADGMSEHGREALWPHAADELLRFLRRRREGLDPRLEELTPDARTRALTRLVRLAAIREGRVDAGSFEMDQFFAHGLMVELMQFPSARPVICPVVHAALRKSLPQQEWLANVFRATKEYTPKIDAFLTWAIISSGQESVAPGLAQLAANQLVAQLSGITAAEREGNWIPGAIAFIADHGALSGYDFLERVVNERKRLVQHAWNKACREAAKLGIQRGWSDEA